MAPRRKRTAQEVIDTAIAENSFGKKLLYAFAAVLFLAGTALLVKALFVGDGWQALAGFGCEATCVVAIEMTERIRKESVALRLLEIPLSNSSTAHDAATAIYEIYRQVYGPQASQMPALEEAE